MRFYTGQHQHYCGIDLHARALYLCVLDAEGNVLLHRNLPCDRQIFLEAVQPFRDDLVVASECIFNWYWLADLCAEHGIAFVLGHALYMRASAPPSPKPSTTPSSGKASRLTWPSARPTIPSSVTWRRPSSPRLASKIPTPCSASTPFQASARSSPSHSYMRSTTSVASSPFSASLPMPAS
jgi:hypothetical protein